MTTTPSTSRSVRRAGAALLALGLLVGAVACSSDGSDGAEDGAATTVADDGATTAAGGGEATDCTADEEAGSGNLSGSAAVLFAADSDSGVTEADITPETTLTVAADAASMTPATLTVSVGQVFGIEIAEGGTLDGIVVGCAGGQTAPVGVPVGFVITAPGTYPVSLDIAGSQLGTITAE